jgi:hypothetical protein
MDVRDAHATEIGQLAKLWFDGWRDAHAQTVPAELTRRRTLESFRERLETALPEASGRDVVNRLDTADGESRSTCGYEKSLALTPPRPGLLVMHLS